LLVCSDARSSAPSRDEARQNEAVRSGMILLTVEAKAPQHVEEIIAIMQRT
jgi:hypothetical protein